MIGLILERLPCSREITHGGRRYLHHGRVRLAAFNLQKVSSLLLVELILSKDHRGEICTFVLLRDESSHLGPRERYPPVTASN